MRGPVRAAWPVLLLLAACSSDPTPPGGVSADEAQQLNEAAASLDANSVDTTEHNDGNEAQP